MAVLRRAGGVVVDYAARGNTRTPLIEAPSPLSGPLEQRNAMNRNDGMGAPEKRGTAQTDNAVKRQYERFPYPRPEDSLDEYIRQDCFFDGCPDHHFHWFWPTRNKTQDLDILIAGCGAGQAAKVALNVPSARVTGIDLSRTSLEHTRMLADRHHIGNLELHELPIEQISELGTQFDLVISTGVLHHLPDPEEGLKALRRVLRRDGSMFLMLYGKYGRLGLYNLQDFARTLGLRHEIVAAEDLAKLRQTIDALPPDHPFRLNRRHFELDLQFEGGLVDAFLHRQDRPYTIPDIYRLLLDCALLMQKLVYRAHYAPACSGLANTPFFDRIKAMPEADQFALTEAFRGSIHTHFFVACRDDRPEETFKIDLNAPDWKQLIPVRAFSLRLSKEDLPDDRHVGWIAWKNHAFKEIRLPVTPIQAQIFNLIDNERTIQEIMDGSGIESDRETLERLAQVFFAAMVEFDYVWFKKPHTPRLEST